MIDDFTREVLNITIDTVLLSYRIVKEFDQYVEWRGALEILQVENGPEFIAQVLEDLCVDKIKLQFIQ